MVMALKKITYKNDGTHFVVTRNGKVQTFVNIRKGPSVKDAAIGHFWDRDASLLTYAISDGKAMWYAVDNPAGGIGYVSGDYCTQVKMTYKSKPTSADITNIFQKLVQSDRLVYKELLNLAAKLSAKKKANCNTSKIDYQYRLLSMRLHDRQESIKNCKQVHASTGTDSLFSKLKNTYISILDKIGINGTEEDSDEIGLAPFAIYAIIVGVSLLAGAGAAVWLYYKFKPKYEQSVKDLKVSKELEKALAALTPAERKKVTDDLNKQIDDAYNQGKEDSSIKDKLSAAKGPLIAIAAFLVGYKLLNIFKNNGK
jgi:hypothetical protein